MTTKFPESKKCETFLGIRQQRSNKLKKCSICTDDKFFGAIHYQSHQKYRLCKRHYDMWRFEYSHIEIDLFIHHILKKKENDIAQTKL